jgi:hypothetical protein
MTHQRSRPFEGVRTSSGPVCHESLPYPFRGRAFATLGRGDRAEAEFARALRLAPDDPKIRDAVRTRPEGHVNH